MSIVSVNVPLIKLTSSKSSKVKSLKIVGNVKPGIGILLPSKFSACGNISINLNRGVLVSGILASLIGPNLDELKLQKSQIIMTVTNGIGVMPPWEGILTTEEIEAVAYYVFSNISFKF